MVGRQICRRRTLALSAGDLPQASSGGGVRERKEGGNEIALPPTPTIPTGYLGLAKGLGLGQRGKVNNEIALSPKYSSTASKII